MNQETKEKISKTLKGNSNCGKKTQFKKGQIPWNKNKPHLKIRQENHYKWKGGSRSTAKRILERKKIDLTKCRICKDAKKRKIIHHHDGDIHNNILGNLAVLCDFCHNSIHGSGIKTR